MTRTESTAKERNIRLLQAQPDDSSFDELLRELVFDRMIERGLADSDAGRTTSSAEVTRRFDS